MVVSNKQITICNPYYKYGNNPSFGSSPSLHGMRSDDVQNVSSNPMSFGGALNDNETNALTDCYISSPSESLLSAAWGGVTFGLINNPRFVVHPIQVFKAFKDVDDMFKPVLQKGSVLNELWTNPETNYAMRDAYTEMHRAFSRSKWKMGLFRKRYSKDDIGTLKGIMQRALDDVKGKPPEEAKEILTRATETLKSAYVTDGPLRFIAKPISNFSGGSQAKTVAEGINNTEYIESKVKESLNHSSTSFKKALKTHAGVGGALLFALFEVFSDMKHIKLAFKKDRENEEYGIETKYGKQQLKQTLIKGVGSGFGWGIGEAVGNWTYTKYLTKLGSKLHPTVGTIVGGVIGLVGASIGMMLSGRLTKKLVGENIGAKLEADELTQTLEGQAQILENVYDKVQKGQASPEAQEALQKIINHLQAQQGEQKHVNVRV